MQHLKKHSLGLTFCLGIVGLSLVPRFGLANSDFKVMMNLFFLTADMGKVEVSHLERLIQLGAQGFELPGTISTPADCERLGTFLRGRGMPVGLNVAVATDNDPSSPDPKIRAAGVAYLKSRIDCAVTVGADILAGPISLPWGKFVPEVGQPLHDLIEAKKKIAVDTMREVATYAQERGVKLALEPLTHWEMPGINTMRETIRFIRDIDHPNFGVTIDTSHEVADGEGAEVFVKQLKELDSIGKIFYVQASGSSRGDLEFSWVPWETFVPAMKKFWAARPIAIEMMNAIPPFQGPCGAGLRLARLPFKDPFEVAGRSIVFLRKMMAKY